MNVQTAPRLRAVVLGADQRRGSVAGERHAATEVPSGALALARELAALLVQVEPERVNVQAAPVPPRRPARRSALLSRQPTARRCARSARAAWLRRRRIIGCRVHPADLTNTQAPPCPLPADGSPTSASVPSADSATLLPKRPSCGLPPPCSGDDSRTHGAPGPERVKIQAEPAVELGEGFADERRVAVGRQRHARTEGAFARFFGRFFGAFFDFRVLHGARRSQFALRHPDRARTLEDPCGALRAVGLRSADEQRAAVRRQRRARAEARFEAAAGELAPFLHERFARQRGLRADAARQQRQCRCHDDDQGGDRQRAQPASSRARSRPSARASLPSGPSLEADAQVRVSFPSVVSSLLTCSTPSNDRSPRTALQLSRAQRKRSMTRSQYAYRILASRRKIFVWTRQICAARQARLIGARGPRTPVVAPQPAWA